MRIALIGGGGFRVPMVYAALLRSSERLEFDELVLHDVDQVRLSRIEPVLEGLARLHGARVPYRSTIRLDEAIDDVDFVFCAIRVGGLEGRVVDEQVPLMHGVVGQETTGPGGICFALRTVPAMVRIAERVAISAPRAWFINFTNPAGLVTEVLQGVLGERALGICDTPTSLFRRVADVLERPMDGLRFDYFGLDHLGWLRGVFDGEEDLLPELIADDERLGSLEEGRLFGATRLRELGMIPNEYLYFYENPSATVEALRRGVEPRAAFLRRQQSAFYERHYRSPAEAYGGWSATRQEREEHYFAEARAAAGLNGDHEVDATIGGYEREALAVVEGIAHDQAALRVVNTANHGALRILDDDAVVEVTSVISREGAAPLPVGDVSEPCAQLITRVKEVERLTIAAAMQRSTRLAVQAIALHPLVPSDAIARRIFADYMRLQPELRQWRAVESRPLAATEV
jgi:6-phospho-beta-glucosidase